MEKRLKIGRIFSTAAYVLDCIILTALVVIAVAVLVQTFRVDSGDRLYLHEYLAFGFVAFFAVFLIPRLRQNFFWLMKFNHEFIHLVFAILFFRKIYRFKVDSEDSYVSYSGGPLGYHIITLAPYCVPLLTLVLLPWRFTTDTANWMYLALIDFLLGFTYAFHVCCSLRQIRFSQTDIQGPGVVKSLLIITLFQLINFCLIVLTPSSGVINAIERVFWEFPSSFVMRIPLLL